MANLIRQLEIVCKTVILEKIVLERKIGKGGDKRMKCLADKDTSLKSGDFYS